MISKLLVDRLSLFKDRNFSLISISGALSTFGNGLIHVTSSWYAYEQLHSISGVAVMMLLLWSPSILFSPFVGAISDRCNKKKLIMLSNGGRGIAIILFSIGLLFQYDLNIFFLVAILGLLVSFYMPAVIPLITRVIPKEDFVKANSTIDMIYEVGTVLGMGASGVLIHFFGIEVTMFIGGILFCLSTLTIQRMKYQEVKVDRKKDSRLFIEYVDSIKYLASSKYLVAIYVLQSFLNVLLMTIPILLVPYVREVLKSGTEVFSIFESVYSLGILIGCFALSSLNDILGFRKLMAVFMVGMALSLFVMSTSTTLALSVMAYFASGLCLASWALIITQTQLNTKAEYQGRLQSFSNSLSGIFILTVYLIMTFKSHWISVSGIYSIQAFCALLVGVVVICGRLREVSPAPQSLSPEA